MLNGEKILNIVFWRTVFYIYILTTTTSALVEKKRSSLYYREKRQWPHRKYGESTNTARRKNCEETSATTRLWKAKDGRLLKAKKGKLVLVSAN